MSGNDIQINDVVMLKQYLKAGGLDPYAEYVVKGIRYTSTGSWVEIAITDYRTMALNACDLIKVDLTKPDYYVYPDTPVGTELVVIRDTHSKVRGTLIPKGTVVTLASKDYLTSGTSRSCNIPKHLVRICNGVLIDCNDLMLKGYPID